ncbi:PLDc N-terminal domain-containing protein [Bernardetia sp.]|uniref:PLDc N-terminal domain-containing protein n=1 Tax=Bernardetia sp. TaxID=1937974 RepID=UPI0025C299E0|nr:PLDc N-terminal domain-containing protein [Bernardetia sp.]
MLTVFLANALNVLSSGVGGILSLLHLILIVYCFYRVWTSASAMSTKVLWSLAIFFLPLLGPILYLLLGD